MTRKVSAKFYGNASQTVRRPVVIALCFTRPLPFMYFKGRTVLLQREEISKIVLTRAIKAYGGEDIVPLILNEMGVSLKPHASTALIPREKYSLVPIECKVGWAPEPVWTLSRIVIWLRFSGYLCRVLFLFYR